MADIRDVELFMRSRWRWTEFGYENGFPRGSQFTDIDAACEVGGPVAIWECKHYEGDGPIELPPTGQRLLLRRLVAMGANVGVLYGDARVNDPWAVRILGATRREDRLLDWRREEQSMRRAALKFEIDTALGLI